MKNFFLSIISALLILSMSAGLTVTAFAEGTAPVAENLELRTYRNVSVGGKLSAYDPEEDVESFVITTEPVKGSIKLEPDGSFVYTPKENKKGKDYFGYKAFDVNGNYSQEATAIITIEKTKPAVSYDDMKGRGGEYAAAEYRKLSAFADSFCAANVMGLSCDFNRWVV